MLNPDCIYDSQTMVRITLLHTLKNLLILYVDDIGKRVPAVYQGLRSIAELVPQSGDENSFVGIYARNSLRKL